MKGCMRLATLAEYVLLIELFSNKEEFSFIEGA